MTNYDDDFAETNTTTRLIKKIAAASEEQKLSLLYILEGMQGSDVASNERDDVRRNYNAAIQFTMNALKYEGIIQNISSGGIFIECKSENFSVGQIVSLYIPFTNKQDYVKAPAEVVRLVPDGIGAKFLKKAGNDGPKTE